MLIAQASDLHLRRDPDHDNNVQFSRVVDQLLTIDPLPDLLILSGDLAHEGDERSYLNLGRTLVRWPKPVHFMVGNHDNAAQLRKVFPQVRQADGYSQATVELPGLLLILLDTTEPGREGGAFCDRRVRWLKSQLDRAGDWPVVVFSHHPPVPLGVPWVDPGPTQSWTTRLGGVLQGRNIHAVCSGHVHTSAVAEWYGMRVIACPSTSSETSLMFAQMDPAQPDGRPLAERSEPGFALHRWCDGQLVTFFGRCRQEVLARWDEATHAVVEKMLAEKIA